MKFRELSYASPDQPRWKRWIIQTIEEISGRHQFLPLYRTWQDQIVGKSEQMMSDLLKLIDVELAVAGAEWPPVVPGDAPLVIVANHPFGIGDGIAVLSLAEQLGRPYRVLINRELLKVPEIRPYSLPIDFDETREAVANNLKTRKEALRLLKEGVTIVVFPAGGVATADKPFGKAAELPWKTFTARMIQSGEASVLPIYFEGQNGWLFHFVSRFSLTLRLALLVSEFKRFAGSVCKVRVGEIVPFNELRHGDDRKALTEELYERVHALAYREVADEPLRKGRRGRIILVRRLREKASKVIPRRKDIKRISGHKLSDLRRLAARRYAALPERVVVTEGIKDRTWRPAVRRLRRDRDRDRNHDRPAA